MNPIFQGYFGHDKPVPYPDSLLKSLSYPGKKPKTDQVLRDASFLSGSLMPSYPVLGVCHALSRAPRQYPWQPLTPFSLSLFLSFFYFLIFPFLYHLSLFPSIISSISRSSFSILSLLLSLFQSLSYLLSSLSLFLFYHLFISLSFATIKMAPTHRYHSPLGNKRERHTCPTASSLQEEWGRSRGGWDLGLPAGKRSCVCLLPSFSLPERNLHLKHTHIHAYTPTSTETHVHTCCAYIHTRTQRPSSNSQQRRSTSPVFAGLCFISALKSHLIGCSVPSRIRRQYFHHVSNSRSTSNY